MSRRAAREKTEAESLVLARRVIRTEAQTLERMADSLGQEFERAVDLCFGCAGRVVLTGMGKSGLICRKVSATLASTGTPSFFLHPAEALHGDLGMLREEDVLLAMSHSGESDEILRLVPAAKRLGLPLILVTGRPGSKLGKLADVVLQVPVKIEADPLGFIPTASTTGALALGDALAVALLVRRGFGEEDFARNHPAGALARKLLKVRDLMHRGRAIPRVTPRTGMKRAIGEMSRGRMGMTPVVDAKGRVAGIVTDGDLRRLLEKDRDALSRSVGDVMTRSPRCISADEVATRALHLMERHRITVLLVTDEKKKLLGILHLHDLWKTELF